MKLLCLFGLVVLVLAKPPSPQQVREAILRAKESNAFKRDLNLNLRDSSVPIGTAATCPLARYHGRRTSSRRTSDRKTNDLLLASKFLKEAGFSDADLQSSDVVTEFRQLIDNCPNEDVKCNATHRFRTANGYCNNLQFPTWGAAGTAQARDLQPAYDDGLSSPRTRSVTAGESLPNARLVSNAVHIAQPEFTKSKSLNLHVFQFGQFLDHDMIATPLQGEVDDCCSASSDVDNCFPIRIEWEEDPNPNFANGYCMNFHRSAPQFCPTGTGGNRREQVNELTSYIDASNIYGSSFADQFMVREGGDGGFLDTTDGGLRLPDNDNDDFCIPDHSRGIECSLSGDHRVNVVPSLTAYHTMFVREHNRIAAQLLDKNTDGELLFQEVRKIMIAIMQKITYEEFLPTFLSEEAMKVNRLSAAEAYKYDPAMNPSISNDFGIAYRMGHTWIPRTMEIFNPDYHKLNSALASAPIEKTFFDPDMTYFEGTRGLDGLVLRLTGDNSSASDRILEDAVRNHLFLDGHGNSFDLAALNIQRGRDHGLPSYTKYRKFCNPGEAEITKFGDLVDHEGRARKILKAVYSDPRDIDMFTGVLSEAPLDGSDFGPTLECILGKQFNRLKYGDRFWYQSEASDFSPEQLKAIEEYSMAKILCNNYDFRTVNYPNAFLATDPLVNCEEVPQLDILPFGGIQEPVLVARSRKPRPALPQPTAAAAQAPQSPEGKRAQVEHLLESLLERLED